MHPVVEAVIGCKAQRHALCQGRKIPSQRRQVRGTKIEIPLRVHRQSRARSIRARLAHQAGRPVRRRLARWASVRPAAFVDCVECGRPCVQSRIHCGRAIVYSSTSARLPPTTRSAGVVARIAEIMRTPRSACPGQLWQAAWIARPGLARDAIPAACGDRRSTCQTNVDGNGTHVDRDPASACDALLQPRRSPMGNDDNPRLQRIADAARLRSSISGRRGSQPVSMDEMCCLHCHAFAPSGDRPRRVACSLRFSSHDTERFMRMWLDFASRDRPASIRVCG